MPILYVSETLARFGAIFIYANTFPALTIRMPAAPIDLPTQAERLRQLYVATAALVAAQHTRGGALRAAEAEVRTRLANLQSAASRLAKRAQMVGGVEARINAHLAAMAGVCVFVGLWEYLCGCGRASVNQCVGA